ncbi:MAG: hypothetical protein RL701_6382 [Pseudomonadota bacterium]|jgi:Dyp-type peroxidase family
MANHNPSRVRGQISELTHIAPIKQGFAQAPERNLPPIRYADRLRIVLEAFNAREDQAAPGVIRIFRGIHVAHWAMLDGDTRLLLVVVFDGELHGYLRALARDVPAMLNLVWSNCEGWADPRDNPQNLIDFIQRFQVRSNFFYAHNPQLTVPDIDGLLRLRDAADKIAPGHHCEYRRKLQQELQRGSVPQSKEARRADAFEHFPGTKELKTAFGELFTPLFTKEEIARAAFETFGGANPKPPAQLSQLARLPQVQSNVLSEYPEAHAARMVFVHFSDRDAARLWVKEVRERVAFGPRAPRTQQFLNVGFTFEGLIALGVDAAALSEFPAAFVQGMEARQKSLGDPDHDPDAPAPEKPWTDPTKPVHAVLFLYAQPSEDALTRELLEAGTIARNMESLLDPQARTTADLSGHVQRLGRALTTVLDQARAALKLGAQAPIDYPGVVFLGQQDLHRPLAQRDSTKPAFGIEYFGFRDGIGQPRLPGIDPTIESSHPDDQPSFDPVLRPETHGLLKNGSFLVARKLRQEPEAFWRAMRTQAGPLALTPLELAESIVGRGLNGQRLDRREREFDLETDRRAFEPGSDASSCPFHSHVRRTNPRTEPDLPHNPRLLRRSLSFVNAHANEYQRGMMFMAFMADPETQFEVIQRHWLQSGNQVGQASRDRDVLTGLQPRPGKAYDDASAARFYVESLTQPATLHFDAAFVTLEWGLYLFFPAQEALQLL